MPRNQTGLAAYFIAIFPSSLLVHIYRIKAQTYLNVKLSQAKSTILRKVHSVRVLVCVSALDFNERVAKQKRSQLSFTSLFALIKERCIAINSKWELYGLWYCLLRRKQYKLYTCFISSSRIKAFYEQAANERAAIPGKHFSQTMIKTTRTKRRVWWEVL